MLQEHPREITTAGGPYQMQKSPALASLKPSEYEAWILQRQTPNLKSGSAQTGGSVIF